MSVFVVVPFLSVSGGPLILLDVMSGRFWVLGEVFVITDTPVAMLLIICTVFLVSLVTSVAGRAWCGWACPQTVCLEFLFRPLERLVEGSERKQSGRSSGSMRFRKILTSLLSLVASIFIAHLTLLYFVGTDRLQGWVVQSPLKHPTPFLFLVAASLLVFLNFLFVRESACRFLCPYARLQSVLFDSRTLVIGYDSARGEPRGKGLREAGDCVDCARCVKTCPTGIDIRRGLQVECVSCAQCIDACDFVMEKTGRAPGLIGYSAGKGAGDCEGHGTWRRFGYALALLVSLGGFLFWFGTREVAEVLLFRGRGGPFAVDGSIVMNHVRIKLRNLEMAGSEFQVEVLGVDPSEVVVSENPMKVVGGGQRTTSVVLSLPASRFESGRYRVQIRVRGESGFEWTGHYDLLGPLSVEAHRP